MKEFRDFADSLGVPFLATSRLQEATDVLQATECDLAISMNFPTMIRRAQMDSFRLGILNLHGGDLPRYRGNACQAWALLNAETRVGLCVHKMEADQLDSGDIIAREYRNIDINTKIGDVLEWIRSVGPLLLMEAVSHLGRNAVFILEKQSSKPENILRCYPLRPEDGRIEWRNDAADILRRINAFNHPYEGAFCHLDGETVRLWHAEIVDDAEVFCAIPGQITQLGADFVDVACGRGKLRLREVGVSGVSCSPNTIIRSIRQRLG